MVRVILDSSPRSLALVSEPNAPLRQKSPRQRNQFASCLLELDPSCISPCCIIIRASSAGLGPRVDVFCLKYSCHAEWDDSSALAARSGFLRSASGARSWCIRVLLPPGYRDGRRTIQHIQIVPLRLARRMQPAASRRPPGRLRSTCCSVRSSTTAGNPYGDEHGRDWPGTTHFAFGRLARRRQSSPQAHLTRIGQPTVHSNDWRRARPSYLAWSGAKVPLDPVNLFTTPGLYKCLFPQ